MRVFTEEEARSKWCPMARSTMAGKRLDNRQHLSKHVEPFNCVASDCMWWMWSDWADEKTPERGYCGGANE